MNGYRVEAGKVIKESRWTFLKVFPLIVLIVVLLAALGFGLKSVGLIGGTIVERKVFENSYQRSESIKSEIATNEATLAEISIQLSNPNLDETTRFNLMAQQAAARIRLSTAQRK